MILTALADVLTVVAVVVVAVVVVVALKLAAVQPEASWIARLLRRSREALGFLNWLL